MPLRAFQQFDQSSRIDASAARIPNKLELEQGEGADVGFRAETSPPQAAAREALARG